MANKRMFTQDVLTDKFFKLSHSAMAFYYTLCLLSDDDGFYGNPRDLMNRLGCKDIVIQELLQQGFIKFDGNGIIVVTHWLWHNTLRRKTYKPSGLDIRNQVGLCDNGTYEFLANMDSDEKSLAELIELNNGNPIAKKNIKKLKKSINSLPSHEVRMLQANINNSSWDVPVENEEKNKIDQIDEWDVLDKNRLDKNRLEEREDIPQNDVRSDLYIPYSPYKLYGAEENIFLSDEELEKIYMKYINPEKLLDKVSYILLNANRKKNHYAYVNKIAIDDGWTTREEAIKKEKQKNEKEKMREKFEKELEKFSEIEEMERLGIENKEEYERHIEESRARGKEQIINALGYAPWENEK